MLKPVLYFVFGHSYRTFIAPCPVVSITIVLAALAGLVASPAAQAETINMTAVTVVLYGTATLQSPSGTTSKNLLAVETSSDTGSFNSTSQPLTLTQYNDAMANGIAQAIGTSLAAQIGADPQTTQETPIPGFVLSGLPVTASILGFNGGLGGTTVTPDPANAAFDAMVSSHPTPIAVTGDTGFGVVDFDIAFTYQVLINITSGPLAGDQVSLFDNFNFYRRDVTEQVAATPLPAAWVMMLSGLAGLGMVRRRAQLALS